MAEDTASLRYTEEHEWLAIAADGMVKVGITDYAAEQLGDVVYVDLPSVGDAVTAGESCGEIESTKSVGELFAPATGTIASVNEALVDDPSLVNSDPFGEGWLITIADAVVGETLDFAAYSKLTAEA